MVILRKYLLFYILFFILLCQGLVFGAGITVYSAINKSTIALDESVTLKLTIAGAGYFPSPKLPKITDFAVAQTVQYTSTDFSQGSPVPYTVFEYVFSPYNKGAFKIPQIYVQYKGYYYASKEFEITVTDKTRNVAVNKAAPFHAVSQIYPTDPIFITSSISKTKALYNEQLIYTYTVFTRVSLINLPKIEFPDYEAFHREPLYYKNIYTTRIQGVLYRAVEQKAALFPFMTDDHVVPGVKMVCSKSCFPSAVLKNSDISQYFNAGQTMFVKQSKSVTVDISPLPLKDKPLSFSGLIGTFDIVTEVDKSTVPLNGYLVLTIRVQGSGNLRSIPDISAPLMDKLREYQSDSFLNYDKKKPVMVGEKLFRIVLVPTDTGTETIPTIGFSYFDQDANTYLTKWSKPIDILITKAEEDKTDKQDEEKAGDANTSKSSKWKYYSIIGAAILLMGAAVTIFIKFIKKR